MSMTLSFTRVTPQELDRAFTDAQWADEYLQDEDLPDCFLEKAWDGIRFLLDAAEVDVDIYDDGHVIDEECTMLGWDADMVANAARTLGATPFETLAGYYNPEEMSKDEIYPFRRCWDDDHIDYLRGHYKELVEFFEATAASGSAAIRTFSF